MTETTVDEFDVHEDPLTLDEVERLADGVLDDHIVWGARAEVDVQNVSAGALVNMSASITGGECPDCFGQKTGPPADFVERGTIVGSWSAQCGGCGRHAPGWENVSFVVDLDADEGSVLLSMREAAAELNERVEHRVGERVDEAKGWLRDAVKDIRTAGLDPSSVTEDDLDELEVLNRGSELHPGVWIHPVTGKLAAWVHGPCGGDIDVAPDPIDVFLEDLDEL